MDKLQEIYVPCGEVGVHVGADSLVLAGGMQDQGVDGDGAIKLPVLVFHQSTKPEPMLRYFFQMLVDENTRLLDPTCGSGSALRAAESLGAKVVLGLEKDPAFAQTATEELRRFRLLRRASS